METVTPNEAVEPKVEPVVVGRDAMLKNSIKRRYVTATLPDWLADRIGYARGTSFRFQSLTESERTGCELYAYDENGDFQWALRKNGKAKWIVATQVNTKGEREWSDEQIQTVSSLDSGLISWMLDQVNAHCAITEADVESIKND